MINRSKIDDGLNYPVFLFQNFQIFCLLSRRHFPCPFLFTKGQLKGQRPAEVTGVVAAVIRWHSKVTVSPPSSGGQWGARALFRRRLASASSTGLGPSGAPATWRLSSRSLELAGQTGGGRVRSAGKHSSTTGPGCSVECPFTEGAHWHFS